MKILRFYFFHELQYTRGRYGFVADLVDGVEEDGGGDIGFKREDVEIAVDGPHCIAISFSNFPVAGFWVGDDGAE